jgi:hypothetical protein
MKEARQYLQQLKSELKQLRKERSTDTHRKTNLHFEIMRLEGALQTVTFA